jgi:hypothetical protein
MNVPSISRGLVENGDNDRKPFPHNCSKLITGCCKMYEYRQYREEHASFALYLGE